MMTTGELPLGFAMALAQHPKAMEYFSTMPRSQQQAVISRTAAVNSKQEMHELVEQLEQHVF